jgi:hypothetical protein
MTKPIAPHGALGQRSDPAKTEPADFRHADKAHPPKIKPRAHHAKLPELAKPSKPKRAGKHATAKSPHIHSSLNFRD